MEYMVPVNDLLKEEITKLNYTLIPPGFRGDVRSLRVLQDSLSKVINLLGEQSAAAQGLNKVITSAEKLRNSPTHVLYLLKDSSAKGGKGEVIGLLKVGYKHLFLFDSRNKVCEVEPLCVLDFFVLRDRQRHGHGRRLFDHMLQDMQANVEDMAIDGPSPKMEQFLTKNYGLDELVKQNNNFAVSPRFFDKTAEISKSGRTTPVLTPAVGRFTAAKPPSSIANIIHGGGDTQYETRNGRVSGRATPEADMMLTEMRFSQKPKVRKVTPEPESEINMTIPELQHKLEKLEVEVRPTQRPSSLRVSPAAPAPAPVSPTAPAPVSPTAPAPVSPTAPAPVSPAALSPAGSATPRRDSQLTDRGYFDVKFYHNKLW